MIGNDIMFPGEMITVEKDDKIPDDFNPEEGIDIIALRNNVFFPRVIMPIIVERRISYQLLEKNYKYGGLVGIVAQISPEIENPAGKDIYKYGTLAKILKITSLPEGTTYAVLHGLKTFKIEEFITERPSLRAKIKLLDVKFPRKNDKSFKIIIDEITDKVRELDEEEHFPDEFFTTTLKNQENQEEFLINHVASTLDFTVEEKIKLLSTTNLKERAIILLRNLGIEQEKAKLKEDINLKVQKKLTKSQREFILQQQLHEIQKELGDDPVQKDIKELKEKAKKKKWNTKVKERFEKELARLERIHHMSPEYGVQLSYLQTLLDLPWDYKTKDNYDLERAEKILNRDHYGLEKVKERILEYLAVLKLKGDLKSPIICLYGPPGVGKTSLGKSIAEAVNRKYVRMSLGGLHDEAEIRGHRKTYIGAMPGRIIQSLRKAKSSNPVFVLDEIDKISSDFRGDPASALLEVLDPEQNNAFYDNYVEIEYDLSDVMFIATANTLSTISPALIDRMEIIEMNGYLLEEKLEIAKRHLIPKQLKFHGVKKSQCKLDDEALKFLIENYTRESGVRDLDKKIAAIVRKVAKEIAFGKKIKSKITPDRIKEFLGAPKFSKAKYEDCSIAGVVTGLAWTPAGGEIMTIEATASRGEGKLSLTGNLGKVMIESATLAFEYIKSHYADLRLHPLIFKFWNVHIHAPEGAIPKDGPSAGITITTALASLFTQRKIKPFLAMTGEITLSGKVLPVGGIKEKILAAKRSGIKEIILSEKNKADIDEINKEYIKGLKFHFVKRMDEVLKIALLDEKVENPVKIGIPKNALKKLKN